MPLYEYQCDACGKRFEIIQKFSDAPPEACRVCGGGPVQRQFSSPAIQFKGTGWYITDYSQKGKPSAKESAADSPTDSGGGKTEAGGGKTDGGSSKTEAGGSKDKDAKSGSSTESSSGSSESPSKSNAPAATPKAS